MGRKSQKEISIPDPSLKKLIKAFCLNVKKQRKIKNLSQQQLAEKAQLAINTVAEIEQQRIENLRLNTVTALGNAFKISPLKLFENPHLHIRKNQNEKQ